MSGERWTKEQYVEFLDRQDPLLRQGRTIMPCNCDYEACHGWAAVRNGLEELHTEHDAFLAQTRSATESVSYE